MATLCFAPDVANKTLMLAHIKKVLLILLSGALLLAGGVLVYQQIKFAFFADKQGRDVPLTVKQAQEKASDVQAAFSADALNRYTFLQNDKEVFSLLIANYQDTKAVKRNAILFPPSLKPDSLNHDTTALRQSIWQAASKSIQQHTPVDALILSWWDDGQRVQFLSGREAWLSKPAQETFKSSLWEQLQGNLLLASSDEHARLTQMARWLTMDSEKALAEIRATFGTKRPLYLVVNNDLLMRVSEMADYGGAPLTFNTKAIQARENLHGDISQIRRWANETGEGNYLVQKEGTYYRAWSTPKKSKAEDNSLLVRLLPFVDSLKKLPENVDLVYQSHWGGYLSIYKIEFGGLPSESVR